jgi:hypothetical protein
VTVFERIVVDDHDLGNEHIVAVVVEFLLVGGRSEESERQPSDGGDDQQGQPVTR